jgi:hypothetical protein
MSEYDFSDCAAIDDYHDAPWLFSKDRPKELGTFEVSSYDWSPHSQLKALCAVVVTAKNYPDIEYSVEEIKFYVFMAENVAQCADLLLDASLAGSSYNQYRLKIIEQLAESVQFATELYDRLTRLVCFAASDERDYVCGVLRTGEIGSEHSNQLYTFHLKRSGKLFSEKAVLSCLEKAHDNDRSILLTTLGIDVSGIIEDNVLASVEASVQIVQYADLAPELPELLFAANESVPHPKWKKSPKPKKQQASADEEAPKPKKPKKQKKQQASADEESRTDVKVQTWKKTTLKKEEDPLPSGLKCANGGCDNDAELAGRCAGLCCPRALCTACYQEYEFRYICDDCKPVTTGGCLSVDTHPSRQFVYHMFRVADREALSVIEYFRTSNGESCSVSTKPEEDRKHSHLRTSNYVSFYVDADSRTQPEKPVQYETFVQARKDGANGRMHKQIDKLISGTTNIVHPKIENIPFIDQSSYKVTAGKCVITLH